jgi:error-prone DNA polymerase
MGFYPASQLVQDARRHGVEVRPVDVRSSMWECTLEDQVPGSRFQVSREQPGIRPPIPGPRPPVLRLGLCLVKGLSAAGAERLVAGRGEAAFQGVDDLAARARLSRRDLDGLAAAGALEGLVGHRRAALWQTRGVDPSPPPLLRGVSIPETAPPLQAPTEGEDLVADYASLGLTLGRHPLALLRERLRGLRFLTAADLSRLPHGRTARAAGLVTNRQRPGSARGVTFVTLEDETGTVNVVVWRDLAERQRRELLGSSLLGVSGVLEREGDVIHLMARRLTDESRLLGALVARSRDFR